VLILGGLRGGGTERRVVQVKRKQEKTTSGGIYFGKGNLREANRIKESSTKGTDIRGERKRGRTRVPRHSKRNLERR